MPCEYFPEEIDPPCTELPSERLEELRNGVLSKEATKIINDLIEKVQCLCDIVDSQIPDQTDFQLYEGFLDVFSHMDIAGDYSATGLPPGLSIDPETGDITGTIESEPGDVTGVYTPTITVIDDETGQPYSQTFNWVTLFTTTPPPPKPEVGACCYLRLRDNQIFCRDYTPEQCTKKEDSSSYGVLSYRGFPVKCSDVGDENCNEVKIGSCCLEDGSCEDNITFEKCVELNPGNFSPLWTENGNCATANCPDPKAACCADGGVCADVTPEECAAINGTFLTGESCLDPMFQGCDDHVGVCCLLTLADDSTQCIENVTIQTCESLGVDGIKDWHWQAQADCSSTNLYCNTTIGACCLNNNGNISCQEVTQFECTNLGGYDWDSGVSCDNSTLCNPDGACCVSGFGFNNCHDNVTEQECQQIANNTLGALGSSWEPFANCSDTTLNCNTTPIGACCIGGVCDSVTTLENCNTIGGIWAGPGTTCVPGLACAPGVGEPYGACCITGDGCYDNITEAVCDLVQGTWVGQDTLCSNEIGSGDCIAQAPGLRSACCLPGGECVDDMLIIHCITIGGDPSSPGQSCQDSNCPE